ncbi:MAG: L,D-transpeptidase family protein [Verrucomicrobiota bacterium]
MPQGHGHPVDVLNVQIALALRGFRVGPMDGWTGPRTRAALKAFQADEGLPTTGSASMETLARLAVTRSLLTDHVVTSAEIAALGHVPSTWLGKSKAASLPHETILESLAERSAAHPNLLRRLNPTLFWSNVAPGTRVILPRFVNPPARPAASVRINLRSCSLRARDASGRILLHAPCSIGRVASSRPSGALRVVSVVSNPRYTFDPQRFPESAETRSLSQRLVLPPGPNSPVGVAWIGLDRPGIGIHGTPTPERVGRAESHGCFRLANWDAAYLALLSWPGLPVEVGDED